MLGKARHTFICTDDVAFVVCAYVSDVGGWPLVECYFQLISDCAIL